MCSGHLRGVGKRWALWSFPFFHKTEWEDRVIPGKGRYIKNQQLFKGTNVNDVLATGTKLSFHWVKNVHSGSFLMVFYFLETIQANESKWPSLSAVLLLGTCPIQIQWSPMQLNSNFQERCIDLGLCFKAICTKYSPQNLIGWIQVERPWSTNVLCIFRGNLQNIIWAAAVSVMESTTQRL